MPYSSAGVWVPLVVVVWVVVVVVGVGDDVVVEPPLPPPDPPPPPPPPEPLPPPPLLLEPLPELCSVVVSVGLFVGSGVGVGVGTTDVVDSVVPPLDSPGSAVSDEVGAVDSLIPSDGPTPSSSEAMGLPP